MITRNLDDRVLCLPYPQHLTVLCANGDPQMSTNPSMSEPFVPVPVAAIADTLCDHEEYQRLYAESIADPDSFWAAQAGCLDWIKRPSKIADWSFDPVRIKWFEDGILNPCYNAVDRHVVAGLGERTAIIFEPDGEDGCARHISYAQLLTDVIKMASVLKELGVAKGDRVTLYMPMIPETAVAMLACARIGAVHNVVFGGFSPEAIRSRIEDCRSDWVICADEGRRGGKTVPLKRNVDDAIEHLDMKGVLVVAHTGSAVEMRPGRDYWYHLLASETVANCPCEPMAAEDPLFILYTSGSTGKPKGLLHTVGGYSVWTATTFKYCFDYRPDEVFWCTADFGWITGHSYGIYGPLQNGATTVIYEGVPNYPDHDRFWKIVSKHKVNILYTAPTAIRALMREGDEFVSRHDRSSLRLLGSVGEPINPEAWNWYHQVVGNGAPVVDTWWQTETGGIMITTLPGAHPMQPGSAGRPFFGVRPQLVDADGMVLTDEQLNLPGEGNLCLTHSWPGQARTLFGDHDRFVQTYFSAYPGKYFTGDGCRRDAAGYWRITGRVDDVINVSGHRLGTAELESALTLHEHVAEAAVVDRKSVV